MSKIEVQKAELIEGEELRDFIGKVFEAIHASKAKLERSLSLHGIYKGFVITRDMESGGFLRHDMTRKGAAVELSDPVEVAQKFVPIEAAGDNKDAKEGGGNVEKSLFVDPPKAKLWNGSIL